MATQDIPSCAVRAEKCCVATGQRSPGQLWVIKRHGGRLIGTAEDPHKADQIAAAPRTGNVCHEPTSLAGGTPRHAEAWGVGGAAVAIEGETEKRSQRS